MKQLTEKQETAIGEKLARDLKLKRDREYPDRYVTEWGTKTALGLYRTIKRLVSVYEHDA